MKRTTLTLATSVAPAALALAAAVVLFAQLPTAPTRPGSAPDFDGDGLTDDIDRCVGTPRGAAVIAEGCSAMDIAQDPEAFTNALEAELDDIGRRMQARPEVAPAMRELDAIRSLLESSADDARGGDLCESANILASAQRNVGTAREAISRSKGTYLDSLAGQTRPRGEGDTDESDINLLMFDVMSAEVESLGRNLTAAGQTFATACGRITGRRIARGRITQVDDRLRRLEVDGVVSAFADAFRTATPLSAGDLVEVSGYALNDGTGIADAVNVVEGVPVFKGIVPKKCLFLRYAPVQNSLPNYNGPFTLLRPEGYFGNNGYLPEQGMGVAVIGEGCEAPGYRADYVRQSVEIKLDYKAKNGSMVANYAMAADLDPSDGPVWFPATSPGYPAMMTVTWYFQMCPAGVCGGKAKFDEEKLPLAVYKRWAFCSAYHNMDYVILEDKDQVSFRPVHIQEVGGLGLQMSAEPEVTFEAEGFKVLSSNTSTHPNTAVIQAKCSVATGNCAQVPFAIFNQDFVPFPDLNFSKLKLQVAVTGVNAPVGLKWPKMTGKRNGHMFSYSCSMGSGAVIRDTVSKADPTLFTMYRFPFHPGYPVWTMGQGNNGAFTHNKDQKYAFDFRTGSGTPIRAARGGVVRFVQEDQTGNMYDWTWLTTDKKVLEQICIVNKCFGNTLIIRHQDGTESAYVHMQPNGVVPQVGDKVFRGDQVAFVGNTGYSTRPHLHFQQQTVSGTNPDGTPHIVTQKSCFEAGAGFDPNVILPCVKPSEGDPLYSTNNK